MAPATFLAALVLFASPWALTAHAAAPCSPASELPVLLRWERKGGIAGFDDQVTIASDYSFVYTARGRVRQQGQLTAEQQKQFRQLLERYATGRWVEETPPGTADGMSVRVELTGRGEQKFDAAGFRAAGELVAPLTQGAPPRQ